MPTYTYHCDACDTPFERVLRMSQSKDPQECPECGARITTDMTACPNCGVGLSFEEEEEEEEE